MNKCKKSYILLIISFFVPFFIMFFVYFKKGIYPGGPSTVLFYDLRSQYFSFYSYLNRIGDGYNNLLFQSLSGFGGGYFGNYAYYTGSPLSWIVCLFSDKNLPVAIWLITLLKIGLCGLAFSFFLIFGHIGERRYIPVLVLSSSYALMSYNMVNSMNLMFLDGVIMLPFVMAGIDYILDEKSPYLFCCSVFMSLIFNYYTAFMIIVFTIFWFAFRCIGNENKALSYFKPAKTCLIYGLLGCLCSSFVIIPVLLDFRRGRMMENVIHDNALILRSPLQVISGSLPFSFEGYANSDQPPIFIGFFSILFSIMFFASKKVTLRKKIAALIILFIFWISFIIRYVDRFWTAFSVSNGYPARYAFLYSFFLISLAAIYFKEFVSCDIKCKLISGIVLAITLCELYLNANYLTEAITQETDRYSDYSEYVKTVDAINQLKRLDKSNGITEDNGCVRFWRYTENDGLLYGVPSIAYFSSSYNYGLHEYIGSLGIEEHYHHMTENGMTPFLRKLFGIGNICLHSSQQPEPDVSFLGEIDPCYFYYDDKTVPVAFMIQAESNESSIASHNPFEMQNKLASEISGEEKHVFEMIDHSVIDDYFDDHTGVYIKSVSVHMDEDTDLWMYVDSSLLSPSSVEKSGLMPSVYFDGYLISEYQSYLSPYLVSLGSGSGDAVFELRSPEAIGDVYLASYKKEIADGVIDLLDSRALVNSHYSDKGIILNISAEDSGEMILRFPYEEGYCISLDGKKINYSSYRNAFLKIMVDGGDHEIRISYFAPGLRIGIAVSLASWLIFVYSIMISKKKWVFRQT